jgi:hypothetical protein
MHSSLMDRVRQLLGFAPDEPSMNAEQERVAARLDRIARRQRAIDIQVDVLRADTHDARRTGK